MNSDQTDQDPQISGHPFEPGSVWPDICNYQDETTIWPCGWTRAEHTDPGPDPEQRP